MKNFIFRTASVLLFLIIHFVNIFGQSSLTTSNIGEAHNVMLGGYLGQYPKITLSNYATQTTIADNFTCNYLSSHYGVSNACSELDGAGHIQYVYEVISNSKQVLQNAFNTKLALVQSINVVNDQVSISIVNNYSTALFQSQNTSAMKSSLIGILATIDDPRLSEVNKEVLKGLVRLSIASVDFWTTGTAPTDGKYPQGFIFGDCVGFLAGWASSAWDEYNSTGTLNPNNATHRLGSGAIWGCAGSALPIP